MALIDKLNVIDSLLTAHFKSLNQGERKEEVRAILDRLKAMGLTSEDSLAELTADDFVGVGVPILIARRIVKAVGGYQAESQKQIVIVDDNPVNLAARLKPEELIDQYDPMDPTSPYGVRLKQISNGEKFLAFTVDGNINVDLSKRFLREILDGYPVRKTALVDGKPGELFAIGEHPSRYADENPAVPGTMLRPDGLSDLHVDWGIIPLDVKQLVWIAVSLCELKKFEVDIYENVSGKTFNEVATRWPAAAVKFEKMKGSESLPRLKLELKPKVVAAAAATTTK